LKPNLSAGIASAAPTIFLENRPINVFTIELIGFATGAVLSAAAAGLFSCAYAAPFSAIAIAPTHKIFLNLFMLAPFVFRLNQ
jgi:hypothetical protein